MKILQDYDLTKLNTFGISARTKFFTEIKSLKELEKLFSLPEFKNNKKIFLGGGSNVLFTKDFDGLVILNKLKGIEILKENSIEIFIKAMSGEIWHDLVLFAVGCEYWGIENLSFIPGTVGAAPMQNIGAYGAELKNVLENVESFEIATGKKKIFTTEECELGYRDSCFKNNLKDKYFIMSIILKLRKTPNPNISYKILKEFLEKPARMTPARQGHSGGGVIQSGRNKIVSYSIKDISDAVIAIRKSKLPDPQVIGNAGSFFKNVFVNKEKLEELLTNHPNMPYFEEGGRTSPQPSPTPPDLPLSGETNGFPLIRGNTRGLKGEGEIKIPAGWLIEQCGWKGKRIGNAGVHDRQALVIVNHGGASGEEIANLAKEIIDSVFEKFGLKLIPEVNLI